MQAYLILYFTGDHDAAVYRLQVSFQMVVHQAPLMNNTQQKTLLSGSNIIQEICYLDCYLDCGQLSSIAVSVIFDLHAQLSGIEYWLGVV